MKYELYFGIIFHICYLFDLQRTFLESKETNAKCKVQNAKCMRQDA